MKTFQLYLVVGQIWCAAGLSSHNWVMFGVGTFYTLLGVLLERTK